MEAEQLLSKGLQQGFAGGSIREGVSRSGFDLESSHFEDDGNVYHDEWKADRVGGGQELVKVGDKEYTRVYAGGTVSEEELQRLGITKKDVIGFLKRQILTHGNKIRLRTNFESEQEGDWGYNYKVIDNEAGVPLTTGKERVYYKGQLVFVHNFLICPVE